jgi:hypothetical protein
MDPLDRQASVGLIGTVSEWQTTLRSRNSCRNNSVSSDLPKFPPLRLRSGSIELVYSPMCLRGEVSRCADCCMTEQFPVRCRGQHFPTEDGLSFETTLSPRPTRYLGLLDRSATRNQSLLRRQTRQNRTDRVESLTRTKATTLSSEKRSSRKDSAGSYDSRASI